MASLEELLAPVSDATPTGRDVSDEVEIFQIAQARTKGIEAEADGDRSKAHKEFKEIGDLATKVLRKDSKDLTVAAWLADSWLRIDGFDGLADGLELVQRLMDAFWDHLFPEDVEGRFVAIEFLGNEPLLPIRFVEITDWGHTSFHYDEARGSTKDTFASGDPKAKGTGDSADPNAPSGVNFEAGFGSTSKARYKELSAGIERGVANLSSLTATCQKCFEGQRDQPSLAKLAKELDRMRSIVSELLARKLAEDPDPPEVEAPGMEDPSASGAPSAEAGGESGGPTTSGMIDREPASASDAAHRIGAAARYLRARDPHDPSSYLLLRALRWGELRAGGSALDVRLLDSPPMEQRKRLKKMALDGEWESLLSECEAVMASPFGRGWLDLQRYTSTALENLGGPFRGVNEAILAQLRLLLEDLPELPNKTLMDDTPTANAETKEWLVRAGLVDGGDASAGGGGGAHDGGGDDPERALSEASYEKAREWAASGNPQQGVELLMRRASFETSSRARFITLAHAASIMVDHGMSAVARPILEDLVQQLKDRKLEEWEAGHIVARPLALLYRCLPATDRTRAQLYDQICRLDPVQAWELEHGAATAASTTTSSARETNGIEQEESSGNGTAVDPG